MMIVCSKDRNSIEQKADERAIIISGPERPGNKREIPLIKTGKFHLILSLGFEEAALIIFLQGSISFLQKIPV
jgi:hypothetical protein